MKINIIYFASLRDASKKSSETIETNSNSIEDLYEELHRKYKFPIKRNNLRVAQNEVYVEFNSTLTDQDTIVFIPPVAGG
jgi:molybdopterin converting factor subunit 1